MVLGQQRGPPYHNHILHEHYVTFFVKIDISTHSPIMNIMAMTSSEVNAMTTSLQHVRSRVYSWFGAEITLISMSVVIHGECHCGFFLQICSHTDIKDDLIWLFKAE